MPLFIVKLICRYKGCVIVSRIEEVNGSLYHIEDYCERGCGYRRLTWGRLSEACLRQVPTTAYGDILVSKDKCTEYRHSNIPVNQGSSRPIND